MASIQHLALARAAATTGRRAVASAQRGRPVLVLVGLVAAAGPAAAGPYDERVTLIRHGEAGEQRLERRARSSGERGVILDDGSRWVFRADDRRKSQELARSRGLPADTAGLRERAFYLTSRHLGLGVVPRTERAIFQGSAGSLQRYAPGEHVLEGMRDPARLAAEVARIDWDSVHAVAILHYVAEVDDAYNPRNVRGDRRTGALRLKTFDGELAFSGTPASSAAQRLIVDGAAYGAPQQLSDRLWRRLRKVDVARWTDALRREGLSAAEIGRAARRLREVQAHGLDALPRYREHRAPALRLLSPAVRRFVRSGR